MKNYTIPFGYNVFNGEDLIFSDICTMTLRESDIKKVADILQQNGGHPVIMGALSELSEKVLDTICDNVFCDKFPEDVEMDDIFVELDEKMPDELLAVVEDILRFKSADIRYYYQANGEEKYGNIVMGISVASFKKMVDAVADRRPSWPFRLRFPQGVRSGGFRGDQRACTGMRIQGMCQSLWRHMRRRDP